MPAFTKSLKGKLAVYFALSIIVSLLVSGLISVGLVQRLLRDDTISGMESQARSIAGQIEEEGELPNQAYQRDLERVQGVSLFVIPREGAAPGPPFDRGRGGNPIELARINLRFLDWDELEAGKTIVAEADVPNMELEQVVVAHGYFSDGELLGAVVLSRPLAQLQPWRPIAGEFLIAAAIALAISLTLAFVLARHLSRPLHEITEAAAGVAEGDFSRAVTVQSEDEIGRLADAFRNMTAEVQNSQQQQREFVINVSHELKTPLTSITGHAQALRDGVASDPADVDRSLDVISTETQRLSRLIDDLISLAKFDTRQFELRMDRVRLEELMPSLVESFSREAGERGVALQLDAVAGLEVNADPDRLRQVLSNLVQNALFHTAAGGEVRIAARSRGDMVTVSIRDSGQGITADELERVFDRFYRAGEGTRDAGLGLGLPISLELARAMGGDIIAESVVGEGSTFTISLPS